MPELSPIKTIVEDYGGHVKFHPEILQIMEDSKDSSEIGDNVEVINNVQDLPSDTKSEVIPEEDQNSEVPSDCSDDLPHERNGYLKSQSNLKSYNIKLMTKSFLFRKMTRYLFSIPQPYQKFMV